MMDRCVTKRFEEYKKEETSVCPKTHRDSVHTLTYKRATCTRVPDTLLHFACSLDPRCKECVDDYL